MKFWLAIASAEHVARGRREGFMQVCHGKAAPLRRLGAGDGVIYYSPTSTFRGRDSLQAFTACGFVRDGAVYQADMGGGFLPFRRDVDWVDAEIAPIRPLLGDLNLTRGKTNWGYPFRFGLLRIEATDFRIIAQAMQAQIPDWRLATDL